MAVSVYKYILKDHESVVKHHNNPHRVRARKVAYSRYGIMPKGTTEKGCEHIIVDVVCGIALPEIHGTSLVNSANVGAIVTYIDRLIDAGADPRTMAVLSYYNGERKAILSRLRGSTNADGSSKWSVYEQVELSSVDAYQGEEREHLVTDFVISRPATGPGGEAIEYEDRNEGHPARPGKLSAHLKSIHRFACV